MVESTADANKETQEENKDIPECVMNDTVRAFEPTLDDVFIILPSGDYQRMLFAGHELREREQTHMNDFREWLKARELTLPDGYDDANMVVLRFLQGLKWDYQAAYNEITAHAQWKKDLVISGYETFKEDLELGVLYGCRRDIKMHPILIINVRRMIDSKINLDRLVAMADFFLNYVIEHAMIPGKIEGWTSIFDLKDVGVTEIPKDRIQGLVRNMSKNYRGRLYRFYATDVTFVVRQLWQLAHRFVDEFTNKKLQIFGNDYQEAVAELIAKENLEERYGGTFPDKKDNFFPP